MKPVVWMRSSKADLLEFPRQAVRKIGQILDQVQRGGTDPRVKSLTGDKRFKGGKVREIALAFEGDAFRTVFSIEFAEAIYVLHCFQKKSTRGIATPKREIDVVVSRLRDVTELRKAQRFDRPLVGNGHQG